MASLEINYYVGDTAPIKATVTDSETEGVFNLTDCKATLTVKANADDADVDAIWRYTTDDQIAIFSASGGIIYVAPLLADSQALTPNTSYFIDLVITDSAGRFLTAASGKLNALRRITTSPIT